MAILLLVSNGSDRLNGGAVVLMRSNFSPMALMPLQTLKLSVIGQCVPKAGFGGTG